MPGDDYIPPPSLPSTAFADSMTVENRLSILHGPSARQLTSTTTSSTTSSSLSSSDSFVLFSEGNADFDRKKNDIFANLGAIEQKHDAFLKATNNNKRMRDMADACVKKDDAPSPSAARFDKKLIDEANKRNKESDGFESFRKIHKNVKNVMFQDEGRREGETAAGSSSPPASSTTSFKIPRGIPNRNRGGGGGGGGGNRGHDDVNRRRRDNRPEKPDFMKNPEKWQRYSLEDVKDVTEASNSAAAFAFLDDLKKRKERKTDDDVDDDDDDVDDGKEAPAKIVFKAPAGVHNNKGKAKTTLRKVVVAEEEEEDAEGEEEKEEEEKEAGEKKEEMVPDVEMEDQNGVQRTRKGGRGGGGEEEEGSSVVSGSLGSKVVMKEYVVGVGSRKAKTQVKKDKPKIGKEIKLSHLDDGEEEDDEDED